MRKVGIALVPFLLFSIKAAAFAATENQASVSLRFETPERNDLIITGKTYVLRINKATGISSFKDGDFELFDKYTLTPTLNTGGIMGAGEFNVVAFGPHMYEVHVQKMSKEGFDGAIEVVLYCYAKRVFVNVNVTPRDPNAMMDLGWIGGITHSFVLPPNEQDLQEQLKPFKDARPKAVGIILPPKDEKGATMRATIIQRPGILIQVGCKRSAEKQKVWTSSLILCAGNDFDDMLNLVRTEMHVNEFKFILNGGKFEGYDSSKGFFRITSGYRGPRNLEDAWVNPNDRIRVDVKAGRNYPIPGWTAPSELICNVRSDYGALKGAVLADNDGFPLPTPVQVSKFVNTLDAVKDDQGANLGESYFPITVTPEKPFEGRVYHLFGNWGTHAVAAISSLRQMPYTLLSSLGPFEAFAYTPFGAPQNDQLSVSLASVRNFGSNGRQTDKQNESVGNFGITRYKSNGAWVNNMLQATKIYLTSPNLANFGLDYLSEDQKVRTSLEVFEIPQDDQARCYIKMVVDVLDTVPLDGPSAQSLQFLSATEFPDKLRWQHLAYTDHDGKAQTVGVSAGDKWALEGVPLGPQWPFVAGYPSENGNLAFFVNRFEGVLGGKPVDSLGLSCFGGKDATEFFLTAPGSLSKLEKGDHIEAHLFVMPFGNENSDFKTAERQRELYGSGIATIDVKSGTAIPGYPRRIKADARGFAEFKMTGGDNWTPILVEGFPSYKAPMLWEAENGQWIFHDQQIYGNDWYQSYTAADGTTGFVFLVKLRAGQVHDYIVTTAPSATAITQRNGFVTIKGGPMDFYSPVKFAGVTCTPLDGSPLLHCVGSVQQTTME